MILRPAAATDLAGIMALEEAFPARQRWSAAAWAEELTAANRKVTVAREESSLLGVLVLAFGDVVDLLRIIVAESARRYGVADTLLSELSGIDRRILLEVAENNEPAKALYAKHGFYQLARRRNYYGQGLDALIMERS